jgi:thioredoxin-dependent peroxiredoxin
VLEIGEPAPDFQLPDADGEQVALADLRGRPVVVYFYPRDDTPGCTTQACGIRDDWDAFQDLEAEVIGISPDTVESHARFREKHDLPFTLLADPEKTVIREYGAWGTRKMYGRTSEGVIRSTVLIDGDGTVAAVWPKVRPKRHAEQVLDALAELGG